jgi:GNAT superfamily N-acetyltransferase
MREEDRVLIRRRRAHRADFDAVRDLLAASGLTSPARERADLRRFRRIVADLGGDLYVALAAERVVGFVHLSYTRQIASAGRARIEALLVAPAWRRQGVASSLVDLALARARRRGCAEIGWVPPPGPEARGFLLRLGWEPCGECLRVDLSAGCQ